LFFGGKSATELSAPDVVIFSLSSVADGWKLRKGVVGFLPCIHITADWVAGFLGQDTIFRFIFEDDKVDGVSAFTPASRPP